MPFLRNNFLGGHTKKSSRAATQDDLMDGNRFRDHLVLSENEGLSVGPMVFRAHAPLSRRSPGLRSGSFPLLHREWKH